MAAYHMRIVADTQHFERRALLCRALGDLLVLDGEAPVIHFERDIRSIGNTGVNIYYVVVDVDTQHFDLDTVTLGPNTL